MRRVFLHPIPTISQLTHGAQSVYRVHSSGKVHSWNMYKTIRARCDFTKPMGPSAKKLKYKQKRDNRGPQYAYAHL